MLDSFDAPPGYIATFPCERTQQGAPLCGGCYFYSEVGGCGAVDVPAIKCTADLRKDGQSVIFIRRPHIRIAKDRQSPGWMAQRLGGRYNWACGDTPEAAHRAILRKLGYA